MFDLAAEARAYISAGCSQPLTVSDRLYEKWRCPRCQELIEVMKEANKHKQTFKQAHWHDMKRKIKQQVSPAKDGYEALQKWRNPGETGFEYGSLF